MKYRAEIDGLRAIAILPVIFFHAGFSVFSGGYVGVDVFFVISGYLIASIIKDELSNQKFSIVRFYERRARRIIPALFLVLLACIPFAWAWLVPADMVDFSKSLVAVPLFSSNFLFWLSSGYFSTNSELKPLLHTWSLAVEEQYYLVFPVLLSMLWGLGRRKILISIAALAALSFILAQLLVMHAPHTAFYLAPSRGWEMLAGAFVALQSFEFDSKTNAALKREIASLCGLFLIIGAIFGYDQRTPFPGVYALLPVVGTALIVAFANQGTLVGKFLSSRFLVKIGLLSYSAYLWHQPVFAFARHKSMGEPSEWMFLGLCILIFALAYLTWRFVEAPFRDRQKISQSAIFKLTAIGSVCFMAVGFVFLGGYAKTLWEIRNPGLINASKAPGSTVFGNCVEFTKPFGDADCRTVGNGGRRVVVWGDSHAGRLVDAALPLPGVKIFAISHPGCPPLIGVRRFDGLGSSRSCDKFGPLDAYAKSIEKIAPDTIILVARWSMYVHGLHAAGKLQREHHFLSAGDDASASASMAFRAALLKKQLMKTIGLFPKKVKIIIVSQPPDYAQYNFKMIERSDFSAPTSGLARWHDGEHEILETLSRIENVEVIDQRKVFCSQSECRTRENGVLLYTDDNHLSPLGASSSWAYIMRGLAQK